MGESWPCPLPGGGLSREYTFSYDKGRPWRLLILPALFDEANKTRHQLVEVMGRLDRSGIDTFLPDLPAWNESLQFFDDQTLEGWKAAAQAAADHFQASHVLTVRASAILAPPRLYGWRYAPTHGANALRALLRARQIAAREAGLDENSKDLAAQGRKSGLELAGYRIGPAMFAALEGARLPDSGVLADIDQEDIGGAGPWLRAEPDYDPDQADTLAAIIAVGIKA